MSDHPSPSGKLIVGREGPVTTITLNRPECHNALDRELSAELNAAVKEISVDRECRVVILRGAGDTFCAGDDIKEFNDWEPTDFIWQVRMYQETVTMIDNLVPVTIAAVDGVCTGGELELTLVCDSWLPPTVPGGACRRSTGTSRPAGAVPRRSPSSRAGERPRSGPYWRPVQRRGGRAP